jgi:transposase-like protein
MTISMEKKEALRRKILERSGKSLRELGRENGVSRSTMQRLHGVMLEAGEITSLKLEPNAERWSSRDKFLSVVATVAMNEYESGEYCRKHGLFAKQLESWSRACIHANDSSVEATSDLRAELKEEMLKSKRLERELARKEKALAETAAILVLRKKVNAIWGDGEED